VIRELLKRFWAEYKAKRALRASARMLEELAETLPYKTLREMYPGENPLRVRNNILRLARLARKV
jgi:hypothetical protein